MSLKPPRKSPSQYKNDLAKVVVSSRVTQKCKDTLEWAARTNDMGMSELVAGVLEDYSDWLISGYMKSASKAAEKFK